MFCGEDIEEEQTQEMKDRLLRVDLRIRVVACSTARGVHRLFQPGDVVAFPSFSMDAVARGTVYRSAASLTVGLVGVFRRSAEAGARQQNIRAQLRYGDPKLA